MWRFCATRLATTAARSPSSRSTLHRDNARVALYLSPKVVPYLSQIHRPYSSDSSEDKLFNKLLVANRGEIACRILRTAKKLGIPTVAIYSDTDIEAPHVRLADEAVHVVRLFSLVPRPSSVVRRPSTPWSSLIRRNGLSSSPASAPSIHQLRLLLLPAYVIFSACIPRSRVRCLCDVQGPSPANESYRNVERVMDAVIKAGADAVSAAAAAALLLAAHNREKEISFQIRGVTKFLSPYAHSPAAPQRGRAQVHPGYSFLSEKPEFAEKLKAQGVTFVGPTPEVMRLMKDKTASKHAAVAAGLQVLPIGDAVASDEDHAVQLANKVGFPVVLKSLDRNQSHVLRIASNAREVRDHYDQFQQDLSFVSPGAHSQVVVEHYLEKSRLIEIQIVADKHGGMVRALCRTTYPTPLPSFLSLHNAYTPHSPPYHLWFPEREASIQRRYQKLIDESPSTFVDAATRKALVEQSVALARSINYDTTGTVEFLLSQSKDIYFRGMSTRLHAGHVASECVTGVDIVELMLRAAAGQKLAVAQEHIAEPKGWAIGARIYSDNPRKNFLPSSGKILRYIEPVMQCSNEGILRIDSGVSEGDVINFYYHPLMSKVTTWAPTRDAAIDKMEVSVPPTPCPARALPCFAVPCRHLSLLFFCLLLPFPLRLTQPIQLLPLPSSTIAPLTSTNMYALDRYYIEGIESNIPFLRCIVSHPAFASGNITTNFIQDNFPAGFYNNHLSPREESELAGISAFLHVIKGVRASATVTSDRPAADATAAAAAATLSQKAVTEKLVVSVDGQQVPVTLTHWPSDKHPVLRRAVSASL
ncbi:unnamed protein product [Closterium sp. NIES-53]